MKIIAYDPARVTLLVPLEEFAPLAGIDVRLLFEQLSARYNFSKAPDLKSSREDNAKNGMRFESGQFKFKGESVSVFDVTAFPDGVVVNSSTTDHAEAFLDDAIKWLRNEMGFRKFSSEPRRIFVSQLVIEFDGALALLMPAYENISNSISRQLAAIFQKPAPMGLARIDFEMDRTIASSTQYPLFTIQRRPGVPFERERYYSGAPMRTQQHIDVLEALEKNLV